MPPNHHSSDIFVPLLQTIFGCLAHEVQHWYQARCKGTELAADSWQRVPELSGAGLANAVDYDAHLHQSLSELWGGFEFYRSIGRGLHCCNANAASNIDSSSTSSIDTGPRKLATRQINQDSCRKELDCNGVPNGGRSVPVHDGSEPSPADAQPSGCRSAGDASLSCDDSSSQEPACADETLKGRPQGFIRKRAWGRRGQRPPPHTSQPFQGLQLHRMTCRSCGHAFVSQATPFNVLSLPLGAAAAGASSSRQHHLPTLQDCLDQAFRSEVIDGIVCPKCSLHQALEEYRVAGCETSQQRQWAAVDPAAEGSAACPSPAGDRSQALSEHFGEARRSSSDCGITTEEGSCFSSGENCARGQGDCASSGRAGPNGHALFREGAASAECSTGSLPYRDGPGPAAASRHSAAAAKRRLQALSNSSAPWPDADYHQLAADAGLPWRAIRRSVSRQNCVIKAPGVLCLQLQRSAWNSTGAAGKVEGHIPFPMVLDMQRHAAFSGATETGTAEAEALSSQACPSSSNRGENAAGSGDASHRPELLYNLQSVIVHHGGASSGHYEVFRHVASPQHEAGRQALPALSAGDARALDTAAAIGSGRSGSAAAPSAANGVSSAALPVTAPGNRSSSGCWFRISDAAVTRASVDAVLSCCATVLLYERQL